MPTLTRTGTVKFDREVDSSALLEHLAKRLTDVHATDVRIQGNGVTFEAGIFRFVTNWNLLLSFGSGELTVDPARRTIQYELSYSQLVSFSAIAFLVGALVLVGYPEVAWLMLVMPFVWLFMVWSNVAIGILRFENFLRRAIETVPALSTS